MGMDKGMARHTSEINKYKTNLIVHRNRNICLLEPAVLMNFNGDEKWAREWWKSNKLLQKRRDNSLRMRVLQQFAESLRKIFANSFKIGLIIRESKSWTRSKCCSRSCSSATAWLEISNTAVKHAVSETNKAKICNTNSCSCKKQGRICNSHCHKENNNCTNRD